MHSFMSYIFYIKNNAIEAPEIHLSLIQSLSFFSSPLAFMQIAILPNGFVSGIFWSFERDQL